MKLLLIGAGNMGAAMLQGLQQYDITVVIRNEKKAKILQEKYKNIKIVRSTPSLDSYIVILAIKPASLNSFEHKGKAQGLISILAGVSIDTLKTSIDAQAYVRVMPNMAAQVQKSATSMCGDESLKKISLELISSIGKCFWLDNEEQLDIATGLAGSAPAWLALVAEGLSDGAVNLGLKRDISYEFIAALFEGVGVVLRNEHPAILKDKVTSPKGTTIAGITKLEEGKVRDSFIKAMEASYKRTKEI